VSHATKHKEIIIMTKFTRTPKNRLKRATGMGDSTYYFDKMPVPENKRDRTRYWGIWYEEAYLNPDITQYWYHEENDYEYEIRITWYPDTKTFVTNRGGCPFMSSHHIGSTCAVCKQKD
jgi:hypothetical protein